MKLILEDFSVVKSIGRWPEHAMSDGSFGMKFRMISDRDMYQMDLWSLMKKALSGQGKELMDSHRYQDNTFWAGYKKTASKTKQG
ncbi:MAG: hypothetical protein FWE64_01640 [Alphaproteobacteria bacterium]|nr:hypothetical protein [Alphaproteobacteria bacterium]